MDTLKEKLMKCSTQLRRRWWWWRQQLDEKRHSAIAHQEESKGWQDDVAQYGDKRA
jgi:hypothetical protein